MQKWQPQTLQILEKSYNNSVQTDLGADVWNFQNNDDKLLEANLNIHIGAILGFPGKVIAFFISLIAASLPVTGFLIWRGRRKKAKK